MKKKNFIVPLDIYHRDVMVSIGQTDDELFRTLKKHGVPADEFECASFTGACEKGRFCLFSGGQTLIRIRKTPKTPGEFGTLQHEIFHIVSIILDQIGMKLKIETSCEAYAYLTGYLTEEIYKRL